MPEEQRRAATRTGRRPRAASARRPTRRHSALATRPHACSDGDAFGDVGARGRERPDERDAEARSRGGSARSMACALGGADGAEVLAAVDAEPADGAAVDLARARGRRCRCGARRAGVGRADGHSGSRRRISVALWPPNPNEFESTGLAPISRALAVHDVEADVVADLLEVRGRRHDAVAQRRAARSTASAAPAPPIMWPSDALGRRDRRRARRRTPCGSPRPRRRR